MAELAHRIVAAWNQAAADLGIDFTSPWHTLTLDHRRISYLGLIHGFGGTTGTVIRLLHLGELSVYEPIDREFHVAKLGSRHAVYDPLVFRGTLIEWGYTGPASRHPHWIPPLPHPEPARLYPAAS